MIHHALPSFRDVMLDILRYIALDAREHGQSSVHHDAFVGDDLLHESRLYHRDARGAQRGRAHHVDENLAGETDLRPERVA